MNARRAGFTLLEVLVAVAVLGLLALLLNQGVSFGMRATAVQQRALWRGGDLDVVDRALRQVIGQADPGIFPEPATLRGTPDAVDMVTELPDPATGQRQRVEARLSLSGEALVLTWRPRRHVISFAPPPPPQTVSLVRGVSGLSLAYSNGNGWASSWSAPLLPAAVRVTIRFADETRRWPPIVAAPAREALEQ